jgi:exopolyphosphatase/guanosine-5'-triphosphate,3'-diphosphate pyrophosphatase
MTKTEDRLPVIAAIDLGTNSFHLVVTAIGSKGTLKVSTTEKEMVRLGTGSGDMKQINVVAMERGINCMVRFAELAKSRNADIVAVATSAVREASNRNEFLRKVKDKSGVDVQVISGYEEGRLIYIGVIHALPVLNKKTLIIDIGGGSTETVVGQNGNLRYVSSAKLGAIRLTKRFDLDTNPTKENIEACREYIHGEWAPTIKRLDECSFETVVGTSGTILNLAVMAMNNNEKDIPDVLNGITVTRKSLQKVINRIVKAKSVKERLRILKIDANRADIILGGALILEYFLSALNIKKIHISTYALREGLVFDYERKLKSVKKYQHLDRLRFDSVQSSAQQFGVDLKHAEHVMRTSLTLFDDLAKLHKLGVKERELLEAAAILHDVGYHISHDMHHKHSYYILKNCLLPGFTNNEKELIANVARYHRKSHPKKKHENFSVLSSNKQKIVRILSSFLRIAEGIDRRRLQNVDSIRGVLNGDTYDVYIKPKSKDENIDVEIWGAIRRKPLLEETFGLTVHFHLDV